MTDIPATKKKLRETAFFLEHLDRASRRPVVRSPEEFDFFLSAFLSAGRSVTFALQKEAKAEYDAWFTRWRASLAPEMDTLLGIMTKYRNDSLKRSGPMLEVEWRDVPFSQLDAHQGDSITDHFWYDGPPEMEPSSGVPVWSFAGKTRAGTVIEQARQYLDLMTKLVADFIRDNCGITADR